TSNSSFFVLSSKKKIFIVDNVIIGANHVISNAGTINTLQSLYPSNTELTFFADAAHIENVKSKVISISNNVIHYNAICVLNALAGIVKKINSWRKKLEEDY